MPSSSSSLSSPSFPFVTSETICASAPGKVILFGEHAVVYGHPAIASALSDLRIVVCLTPLLHDDDDDDNDNNDNGKNDVIHIVLPDLPTPVDITIALETLLDDMLLPTTTLWPVPPQPTTTANDIANCVRDSFAGLNDLQQTAIIPILYLMKIILFANNNNNPEKDDNNNKDVASSLHHHRGWHVYVSSQNLPVGAGLGSSAAFSVALAAALLQCHHGCKPDLDVVNQYAYYAETLLHGHPSGLDNAVSTYGGALTFTKHNNNDDNNDNDDDKGAIQLHRLPQFAQLDMLLVHTHVPRSTKALVAHVRTLYTAHPTVVQAMLRAMGEIAQAFGQQQQQQQADNDNGVSFSSRQQLLLDWVRFNHALLRAVGVSHESLERIVDLVDKVSHGRAAAKLTGAGGGGCALVVGDTKDILNVVQQALPKQYTCFSSTVGGPGVQWHDDPTAVLPPPKKTSPSWWWSLNTCNDKRWTAIVATTFVVAATMSAAAFVRKRT